MGLMVLVHRSGIVWEFRQESHDHTGCQKNPLSAEEICFPWIIFILNQPAEKGHIQDMDQN